METVKSVRQLILVNDWAVSIDLTDAYLHVPIHPQSRKYLVHVRRSDLPIHGLTFRNVPKSLDFHQTNGRNSSTLASTFRLIFSIPRWLAYKRSNSQQTCFSHNILPSNGAKSKVHSKSKEVRFDTSPEIHLYRDGISDTTKHSQGTGRLHRISTSDYQTISFSDSSFGTNFPISFGQTQCSDRLLSPRPASFSTTIIVSLICLETPYSSSRSSGSDQQYDSISYEMVDGRLSFHSGNVQSSSRSQCIPFYGCQSLWIGSSYWVDETILSWSLVGKSIPAPYQYSGTNGHSFNTEESYKIHTPLLCHDFYQQYNSGLLYQLLRRNTFPQPIRGGMGDTSLVPGTRYCYQNSSYSRQIQYIGRPSFEIRQTSQNSVGFGSVGGEFHFSDVQFSQCGFFCDTI